MKRDAFDFELCGPPDLANEAVLAAEESERVLALLGRGVVDAELAQTHQAIADWCASRVEDARERLAVQLEGAGGVLSTGLVQTTTTHTRVAGIPLPVSVAAADAARLVAVECFRPDANALRLRQLRKAVGVAAYGHVASASPRGDDVKMITLTYARIDDWRANHIRAFTTTVREWFRRRGWSFRYVWVAELQERGATHYHVAVWVPRGAFIPYPDQQGWWAHGSSNVKHCTSAVGYLMAYLKKGKEHQKDYSKLPKGARCFGVGGLTEPVKKMRRWLNAPTFVRRSCSINDDFRRAQGGGWAINGRWFASEFARVGAGVTAALQRVCTHVLDGAAMPEGVGPFSWMRGEFWRAPVETVAVHRPEVWQRSREGRSVWVAASRVRMRNEAVLCD